MQYQMERNTTEILYCRMPARRGLRNTALAPGRDETRQEVECRHTDRPLKNFKIQANIRPVLLRQGEPGTPQYISSIITNMKEQPKNLTNLATRLNGSSFVP